MRYSYQITLQYLPTISRLLLLCGDYTEAHDYLRKAIELHGEDEDDADIMICYCTLAAVCTELMAISLYFNALSYTPRTYQKNA